MRKLAIVILAALALTAGSAWADGGARVVEVVGEASTLVSPTEAVVVLGTSAEAPAAAKAASRCAAQAQRLLVAIKKAAGCSECISTAGYRLEPVFEWDKSRRTRRLKAYRASNYFRVVLAAGPEVARVIDAAVAAGATEIKGPWWRVRGRQKLLNKLMAKAVANARARAEVLARAAGVKVGKVVEMRLMGRAHPPGRAYLLSGPPAREPTPVVAGMRRITLRVMCVFELE